MIQFFAPDILESLSLPESDSAHCVRVLRMNTGDIIQVVDGKGHIFKCRITDAHPKHTSVQIIESQTMRPVWANPIVIAVAPTKNIDRMEWLVEKLVEIGVDRIVPLLCRHSERKTINSERLRKIAISAMKQSLKAVLPEIYEMTPFDRYISSEQSHQRFVAYCDPSLPRKLLARTYEPGQSAAILIGPEGDFDPAEINAALSHGWQPVTLGDNRLRTETAALVACDTCHIISQSKI